MIADNKLKQIDLSEFLSYFDFDYAIVSPDNEYEIKLRQELYESGELNKEYLDQNLISLIDLQGAYLGDIDKERYLISKESLAAIISRLDVYINDSVISEFKSALSDRGIDTSYMNLSQMVEKAKEINIRKDEVSLSLANYILNPDLIYIKELNKEKQELNFNSFIFEDEIIISDDNRVLNGYLPAYDSLVSRLIEQDNISNPEHMDNINFYCNYDVIDKEVSLEGSYYFFENNDEKRIEFTIELNENEKAALLKAFELYLKQEIWPDKYKEPDDRKGGSQMSLMDRINEAVKEEINSEKSFYEFKTIDINKYEPEEEGKRSKVVGTVSCKEVFDMLYKHLESVGLMPDEYFILNSSIEDRNIPKDFYNAVCETNWGGSEGIYLDLDLIYAEDGMKKRLHFATGKTLDDSDESYLTMSRVGAECCLMFNSFGNKVKISKEFYNFNSKSKDISEDINR